MATPGDPLDALVDAMTNANRTTADAGDLYRSHRNAVMALLLDLSGPLRCVLLGAGNCNDVDLRVLASCYREVRLVDIDTEAVERAVALRAPGTTNIVVEWADLDGGARHRSPGSDVQPVEPWASLGRGDVVVSLCLLSQMIGWAHLRPPLAGAGNATDVERLQIETRDRHIANLAHVAHNGANVVIVSDLVSSETLPQLLDCDPAELSPLAHAALAHRNFFTGTNPYMLAGELRRHGLDTCARLEFWRWQIGPGKVYLVFAIRLCPASGWSGNDVCRDDCRHRRAL